MGELVEFITKDIEDRNDPECHGLTCSMAADQFHLWQTEPGSEGYYFPLWLSFVVQGIGRDLGIFQ